MRQETFPLLHLPLFYANHPLRRLGLRLRKPKRREKEFAIEQAGYETHSGSFGFTFVSLSRSFADRLLLDAVSHAQRYGFLYRVLG
jgi:hypothetical protein